MHWNFGIVYLLLNDCYTEQLSDYKINRVLGQCSQFVEPKTILLTRREIDRCLHIRRELSLGTDPKHYQPVFCTALSHNLNQRGFKPDPECYSKRPSLELGIAECILANVNNCLRWFWQWTRTHPYHILLEKVFFVSALCWNSTSKNQPDVLSPKKPHWWVPTLKMSVPGNARIARFISGLFMFSAKLPLTVIWQFICSW